MPPKNKKESGEEAFWRTAKAVRKRFLASQALRSGKLDRLRAENLEQGDLPWRIIRYRRVADPKKLPIPLAAGSFVKPAVLEKHLLHLKQHCSIIPLPELIALIAEGGEVPEKTVALTFDCGHMDAYLYAFPLLLKHSVSAAFFLPTAYIGSKSFFFEDRLAMALLFMRRAGLPLPDFTFLGDDVRERIEQVAPDFEVNDQSMALYIAALLGSSLQEQLVALEIIGTTLQGLFDLPDYEDFMRWDDVRYMQQQGMSIGMHGNGYFYASHLTQKGWQGDIEAAETALSDQGIPFEKIFAFPQGELSRDVMSALNKKQYEYTATIGPNLPPSEQTQRPIVLPRVAMAEENAFCTELFACRLWGIELSGISY